MGITLSGCSIEPITTAHSPNDGRVIINDNFDCLLNSIDTITASTITASSFFKMAPYTGSDPASPSDNDIWMHSGATITLNYRIGGTNYSTVLT